jgi:hypothetical protein
MLKESIMGLNVPVAVLAAVAEWFLDPAGLIGGYRGFSSNYQAAASSSQGTRSWWWLHLVFVE